MPYFPYLTPTARPLHLDEVDGAGQVTYGLVLVAKETALTTHATAMQTPKDQRP